MDIGYIIQIALFALLALAILVIVIGVANAVRDRVKPSHTGTASAGMRGLRITGNRKESHG